MEEMRIKLSLEKREGKYPLKEVTIYLRGAEEAYEHCKEFLEYIKYKEEKK